MTVVLACSPLLLSLELVRRALRSREIPAVDLRSRLPDLSLLRFIASLDRLSLLFSLDVCRRRLLDLSLLLFRVPSLDRRPLSLELCRR